MAVKKSKRKRQYYVYVIELRAAVLKEKKFLDRNPKINKRKPCYYVGSTYLTPEKRAKQHENAVRNARGPLYNKFAHKYFDGLVPVLYEHLNPLPTREVAIEMEKDLAEDLMFLGHGVWWN